MKNDIEISLQKVAFNIKKSRKDKGKSQKQVAKKLKISQNAFSKLERGKTKITLINLMIIADYLGIAVSELLP